MTQLACRGMNLSNTLEAKLHQAHDLLTWTAAWVYGSRRLMAVFSRGPGSVCKNAQVLRDSIPRLDGLQAGRQLAVRYS